MRLHRFIPYVVLSVLAICSLGARHRHPVWATRPMAVNAGGVLPVGLNGGLAANRMSATGAGQSIISAYQLLASADHDYNGHRVQAMASLRKAAKRLRISLQGSGSSAGKQPQADSDAKLRKAQEILQQAQGSMGGGSRRGAMVRQHVNEAIGHITTALQTR
jgi:hypothetical protein